MYGVNSVVARSPSAAACRRLMRRKRSLMGRSFSCTSSSSVNSLRGTSPPTCTFSILVPLTSPSLVQCSTARGYPDCASTTMRAVPSLPPPASGSGTVMDHAVRPSHVTGVTGTSGSSSAITARA